MQSGYRLCSGQVLLICDSGSEKKQVELTLTSDGVLVPAGIGAEQLCLESNGVIIVFCDQVY